MKRTVSKELDPNDYRIDRRRKGTGGKVWYEDTDGTLKFETE